MLAPRPLPLRGDRRLAGDAWMTHYPFVYHTGVGCSFDTIRLCIPATRRAHQPTYQTAVRWFTSPIRLYNGNKGLATIRLVTT